MFALDPVVENHALASVRALPINTLFVQSVLRGDANGRVFVDDTRSPGAFYAVHAYGMALLWGHARGDRWLDWLRAHLIDPGHPAEWLQVFPESWSGVVETLLGDRLVDALVCTRVNFVFDRGRYRRARVEVADAMAHAAIVPTTEHIFAHLDGSVVPKQFWRDASGFVRSGGGFSLVVGDEIAATAFCSFRHGSQLEIGVETASHHRGRGYARVVVCALIDECLRQGLEPVWACRHENAASFRLACALGFEPVAYLPYYRLPARVDPGVYRGKVIE